MTRVDTQQFLTQVSKLLSKANDSQSSVYFTQKRYIPYDEVTGKQLPTSTSTDPTTPAEDTTYSILLRATNGASDKAKKIKYSTVISADELETFWKEYANVLKNGVTGLKKKDKKKGKKGKKGGVSK